MKISLKAAFGILTLAIMPFWGFAETKTKYPVDAVTQKISIENTIEVQESKQNLDRRAMQFIIGQNFEREENIRCKDKSNVVVQIVKQTVTYHDSVDGVYLGNGFFNYEYRGKERFLVTFNYKIVVNDNKYSYRLTNFKVLEFVKAPKNKEKRTSVSSYGSSVGISGSSGFVQFSASDVRKFDLEEFVDRPAFEESQEGFNLSLKTFRLQLKNTLTGQF